MSDKPEVNVQRRRKGSKPTSQAARPSGRPSTAGSSTPTGGLGGSGSGGYTSGSGPSGLGSMLGSGGSRSKLGCGGIALIVVILILWAVFSRGCEGLSLGGLAPVEQMPGEGGSAETLPTSGPTRTPRPTLSAPASADGNKWLVMVYQDGDDQALEQDIFIDLNEMERSMASTDQVVVVSQIDRYRSGFSGDGNWQSARRYLVMPDDDLTRVGSDMLMDLGEVNMADGDSLVDFVTWAAQTYPADKYMLIMSDHGMGWPGGWTDPNPGGRDSGSAPLVSALPDDALYLNELDAALAEIQASTAIDKFELIGLDACLMSQLEVYTMLQPYARYAVASEETEPGLGWAYSAFLSLLVYDPATPTADVAANIVETYINQDERVIDDQARFDFLQQNSNSGGFFGVSRISAEQLAGQLTQGVTLAAVNLEKLPALQSSFNDFLFALQSVDQRAVASARSYAQSYTSIFGTQVPPSYIDLGNFVALVAKNAGSAAIRQAAANVESAINDAVIAERHGEDKPGSSGIAIYFPNSQLYGSSTTGMRSYTVIAEQFTRQSLWDDFLGFHYSGRQFQATAAEPVTAAVSRAPGKGEITISAIQSSASSISAGEAVTLRADIGGTNIGYIYLFTGLYDETSNSIYVADTDYLESPESAELGGVYYPAWPQSDAFTLSFDFEPLLFTISDGSQQALALFEPVSYGANAAQAVYAVRGTYTFAQSGEQRLARLYFKDGNLFQVMGFVGSEEVSEASEITPQTGDTFTPSRKWLELDTAGNVTSISYDDGDTLTFGTSSWVWEQVYAPAGQYLVGFLVSDLDGNLTSAYTQIQVK